MPKICYVEKKFRSASLEKIWQAEEICEEYAAQGLPLTLRQLYYQFVARGLIENSQKSYDNLGSLINDARLAGYIDWHHLEDRTRNVRSLSHWGSPADILDSAAASFRVDMWERQPNYCEVWIEKDALVGVIERACTENDVSYFSCRGYTSQSEVWQAAQRIREKTGGRWSDGQKLVTIIHLGDHDPSGIDMTRDIGDRLEMFVAYDDGGWESGYDPPTIRRIALNSNQVEAYQPPPNPAKLSDSRATGYVAKHGYESWELDALSPTVIDGLIRTEIEKLRDPVIWQEDFERMEAGKAAIREMATRFRQEQE